MKVFLRALLYIVPLVGVVLGVYTSCKTKSPDAELRDTFSSSGAFSGTQLRLIADETSGKVVGVFDGSRDGVAPGDQVAIHWGVYPAQSTVECETLQQKQTVQLSGAVNKLTFEFQVNPAAFKEQWKSVQQAATQHSAKGPYEKSSSYKGHPVVEGCLKLNGKAGFAAQGAAVPEVKKSGFGLQDGDDPSQPAHIQYAERCMQAIGYMPPLSCNDMGQVVPITLNGVVQEQNPATCDKPVYLPTGQTYCNTNTRVGRVPLFKDAALTQPIADREAQAVFFCRHYTQQTPERKYFSDVAIIMQNQQTGKSCYFQALGDALFGYRAPPPNETDAQFAQNVSEEFKRAGALPATRFWLPPQSVARIHCVACHDNDPFMHSPWIDQVKHTDGSLIVPSMPFADYKIIGAGFGFENWDTSYAIEPNDNPDCANCHKISSLTTCKDWLNDAYPLHEDGQQASASDFYQIRFKSDWAKAHPNHHWMPPPWLDNDIEDYRESVKDYRKCCEIVRNAAPRTGFINRPTGHKFSQEQLDSFDAQGCYVYPNSEVVER